VGYNTYWYGSDVFSERLHNELPDKVMSHYLSEVTFVEDFGDVPHGDLSKALDLLVVNHQLHGGSQLDFPAFLELLLVVGIFLLERCVPGFCLVEGGFDLFILFDHGCL
jgi:hypothetical protein